MLAVYCKGEKPRMLIVNLWANWTSKV